MSFPLNEIDFFHEGERLSPAKNFLLNGKIWSGALFIHNAFLDLFVPVIGWTIFGKETIGSYRLFILILILFTKFVLLILCYKISTVSNLDKNTKIIYFTLIAVTTLQLTEYTFGNAGRYISYRELPILLFLIFSLEVVLKQGKNHYAFLIGLLSSSSIIFLIDRGIYTNVLILFLTFFCLLRRDFSSLISIIAGTILSWIILYMLVGNNEFNFLFKDTIHYLSIKGFVDSYIYPTPFIAGKFFTTKGIILVTVSGLLTIYSLLIKKENKDNSLIFYFLIIFIFSILTYKNALGRADVNHVRYSTSFSIILISLILFKEILLKINKKFNLNKISQKVLIFTIVSFFISILIFNNYYLKGKNSPKTFDNLINIKHRINQYINLSDKIFVQPELIPVINYYKELSKKDNCVQALTNEPAWTYLTKKEMCTKHYILLYAASDKLQEEFIDQLSDSKARYLLVDAPDSYGGAGKLWVDGIDYEKRHTKIHHYLNENFQFHKNINGWIFYKKKI